MPKTISESSYKEVAAFLDAKIEPKIRAMVDAVNKYLIRTKGVRIGIEIRWPMEELSPEEVEEALNDK